MGVMTHHIPNPQHKRDLCKEGAMDTEENRAGIHTAGKTTQNARPMVAEFFGTLMPVLFAVAQLS